VALDRPGTELFGTIHLDRVFGPPNWGDDPKHDSKIQVPILYLSKPISVCGGLDAQFDAARKSVASMSLGATGSIRFKAGQATVSGLLEKSDTISQITDYFFEVKSLRYRSKHYKLR
jgi:hypothetical protein